MSLRAGVSVVMARSPARLVSSDRLPFGPGRSRMALGRA